MSLAGFSAPVLLGEFARFSSGFAVRPGHCCRMSFRPTAPVLIHAFTFVRAEIWDVLSLSVGPCSVPYARDLKRGILLTSPCALQPSQDFTIEVMNARGDSSTGTLFDSRALGFHE